MKHQGRLSHKGIGRICATLGPRLPVIDMPARFRSYAGMLSYLPGMEQHSTYVPQKQVSSLATHLELQNRRWVVLDDLSVRTEVVMNLLACVLPICKGYTAGALGKGIVVQQV